MWVVMIVLASCQDAAEDTRPGGAVAEQSGYPSLHSVPPRPQLSYTVEQRRAIADGLIADRENARYSNQVVRYRTGLSGLPPPDAPPVAAAPLTPVPDVSNPGDASRPPDAVRDRPVAAPETEFDYHDDDIESFLDEIAGDRMEGSGAVAPGPQSSATPLGRAIVRAGAARTVGSPAAAYNGPPPGAVWAIPAESAGVPDAPLPTAASAAPTREPASPPARVGASLAGRAPGVVWGMVDMPDRPAEPAVAASAVPGAVTSTASPSASAAPGVPATATRMETRHQDETTEFDEKGVEATAAARAERRERRPPFELPADAAGIEIGDGLIAVALAPSPEANRAADSIAFAPGSATLPPDAALLLERFLAKVKAPDVRVSVVGEADVPALALDRALAVGLALVRRGVPADRLQVTMARDAAGDQVRLSAGASAP